MYQNQIKNYSLLVQSEELQPMTRLFFSTDHQLFISLNASSKTDMVSPGLIRHMHPIKPKGLSLGLGFQFFEY